MGNNYAIDDTTDKYKDAQRYECKYNFGKILKTVNLSDFRSFIHSKKHDCNYYPGFISITDISYLDEFSKKYGHFVDAVS